jgi:hypothetical protein
MRTERGCAIEVQSETAIRLVELLVWAPPMVGPEQSAQEWFEEGAAPRFALSQNPAREPVDRATHGEMPAVEVL